jgi:hypothetical protein
MRKPETEMQVMTGCLLCWEGFAVAAAAFAPLLGFLSAPSAKSGVLDVFCSHCSVGTLIDLCLIWIVVAARVHVEHTYIYVARRSMGLD